MPVKAGFGILVVHEFIHIYSSDFSWGTVADMICREVSELGA
jgi:hypothetical protein